MADWRDSAGKRHRKGFATKREAERDQEKMQKTEETKKAQASRARRRSSRRGKAPTQKRDSTRTRQRVGPATAATIRKELARCIKHLTQFGTPPQTATELQKVRQPRPRTTIATPDELIAVYTKAQPWMSCLIIATAGHGMRLGEAMRLCPAMYDAQNNTVTFRTKGQDTNTLSVTDELREILKAVEPGTDPNTPLIATLKPGGRCSRSTIQKAGELLKARTGTNPQLRFHDLRRTLAVRVYDHTKDVRAVQQILGHRNLQTTCIYLEHRDQKAINEILNSIRVPYHQKAN